MGRVKVKNLVMMNYSSVYSKTENKPTQFCQVPCGRTLRQMSSVHVHSILFNIQI